MIPVKGKRPLLVQEVASFMDELLFMLIFPDIFPQSPAPSLDTVYSAIELKEQFSYYEMPLSSGLMR